MKMIDHSFRSKWAQGPSRSGFWVEKCDPSHYIEGVQQIFFDNGFGVDIVYYWLRLCSFRISSTWTKFSI